VVINHGFGYKTRYAHMEDFNVKKGDRVKRGDLIGTVGNSGLSTAPHLHYEILKDNKKVNPVNYFYMDLNDEEYEKILELASIENQSLS
jgi:murein DD-endopeptidase MepM/ murein hydrolase activator NlpD